MKYGDFKQLVASFLIKKNLTTQIPSFIETAKLNIQLKHNFAFTRTKQSVSYPSTAATGVALPSDFKEFAGDYPVEIVIGNGVLPIALTTEERERQRVARTTIATYDSDGETIQLSNRTSNEITPVRCYLVMGANLPTLFTVPEQLSASLVVYYYRWLSPYTQDTEEDFLLLRGHNFLLWETLKVANVFLYEEDKIPLDVQLFMDAFDNFMKLDDALRHSNAPVDVD